MVAVDATLQVLAGAILEPLEVADDAESPTGRALPVIGPATNAQLRATPLATSAGQTLEVTGSAAVVNADVVASTDVSLYRWVSLQILGTWVGTITFQGSNDGTNWVSVGLMGVGNGASPAATSASSNSIWAGPINTKFFRARMTSYTSGTATGRAEFATSPSAMPSIGTYTTINGGNQAHDAVDSGNPVKIGGKANSAAPAAVAALDRVDAWYDLRGQAVVELRDSAGVEIGTPAAPVNIAQTEAVQLAKTAPANTIGTTIVHTPAAGKKVRITYYNLNADAGNAAAVTASLRFGVAGADLVKASLVAGAILARNIGAGKRYFEGAINESLIVNLSAAQLVNVNIEYAEI